ncbi:MAG: transcriptional repressor [Lachnospiraceae bacterium]|nr:transcriptional repressor [Lachnospiraceae bacterium]
MNFETFEEEQLKARLKEKGLKITSQRLLILRILTEARGAHLTAEEIYRKTCELGLGIGLATVYRSIQLLVQLGLVDRINLDDGNARYEISDIDESVGAHHRHHHLICIKCGNIIPFEKDLLDDLELNVSETTGFRIVNHEVRFYGYCAECAKKMDEGNTSLK